MTLIRPVEQESKYVAALAAPVVLAEVVTLMTTPWTCRFCGYEGNSLGNEICGGCRREDCSCGDVSLEIDARGRVKAWQP